MIYVTISPGFFSYSSNSRLSPMGENKMAIKPLIDTKTGIFCHLLQVGATRIIIDCGIGNDFDYSVYDSIREIVSRADCILLTSFNLQHMGAVGLFKDSRVFCTIPTAVLGKIMLDELHGTLGTKVLNTFSPKQIKFSQPFKINDVEITSFNAGYIVGNAIYRIVRNLESVVVCYNFNHRKENFLDGFSHANVENSSIFMTNTRYLSVPSHSLRSRDESIQEIVSKCPGKVIFSVSCQRLVELMCILHNHKMALVSRSGRVFMDRIKSMVEWAGSKAVEIVPQLDVAFHKVEELSNQRIIILVNETHNEGYLGAVVQRFNQQQNTLVLVDQEVASINFAEIKIYEYTYHVKEAVPEVEEAVVKIDEDEDDDEDEHWSKEKATFFVRGPLGRKDLFPHTKRRRQNNEYGEPVTFRFEKKAEVTEIKASAEPEVEEIEEKVLVGTGVVPELNIMSISLYGISDYTSYKTICEGSNSKMYVIAEDNRDNAQFLCSYFNTCRLDVESYIADTHTSFSIAKPAEKVTVTENVMNLDLHRIGDKSLAHFRAVRTGDVVDYVGGCRPLAFGNFDFKMIKRLLIEGGFQIESDDETIVINNEMRIRFEPNGVLIETSESDLLVAVRSVLYRQVAIV